jgi:hypothetical protein
MTAINFPDSPSNGDTHVVGGVTYTYDSTETKWKTTINSNAFLPLTGGTLSGNLTLGSNQLTAGGLTYPTSDGTTGQYLQTDGAGALSFQTVEGLPDAIDVNASAPADSLNIDTSGRVGIATTNPSVPLEVESAGTSNVRSPAIRIHTPSTATGGDTGSTLEFSALNSNSAKFVAVELASRHVTTTAGSEWAYLTVEIPQGSGLTRAFTIADTIFAPLTYNLTTGSGANVYIHGNGGFLRSTSSIKYKTDVETLEDSYADALLECRPVWYRSLSANDSPDHGYWGFIAEEVAEIDPRLVHWRTVEVTKDENGETIEVPCEPEAEGVQYDRFVPHLINLVKRQKEQIEALETRIAALEGGTN